MKKTTFIKTMLTTLILTTAHSVLADDALFKVAVIKGAVGTLDITKGEVESGIKKLTASKKRKDLYANKMNLCVAYLQTAHNAKSELVCTEAINSFKGITSTSPRVQYLSSLNYSNRGVARYKTNQLNAALTDFEHAVLIDNNPITASNLRRIKLLLPVDSTENSTALSD